MAELWTTASCARPSFRRWAKRPCAMSLEAEIKKGHLVRGRFHYFPVVPGKVEFAVALRKLLLAERPKIVAVELPGFLKKAYRRALARLPVMSGIVYSSEGEKGSGEDARSGCV